MDQQAEQVFRAKLASGEIRFDLEASDHNHRMRKSYEILVSDNDVLLQRYGQSVQLSLLSRCSTGILTTSSVGSLFTSMSKRRCSGGTGWQSGNMASITCAAGGVNASGRILWQWVVKPRANRVYSYSRPRESTLMATATTEYKKRVFDALEETFNVGKMTIHDGPAKGVFRLVFDKVGFPDAETALNKLKGVYTH